MANSNDTIKCPPFILYVILLAFGALFFGIFAHFINGASVSPTDSNPGLTLQIKNWIAIGFAFMAIICMGGILTLKTVELNKTVLLIKRPLLFYSRQYNVADIKHVTTNTADVSILQKAHFNTTTVYNGENLLISLKNGNTIKIWSLQISNYERFKKRLSAPA